MSKNGYNLGDEVKDEITGLTGIAIGRCAYLYGCTQVGVQGPVGKDGVVPDSRWIDEQRIKLVKRRVVPRNPTMAEAGGPDTSPKMGGRR